MCVLHVNNLSVQFQKEKRKENVLRHISYDIQPREVVGIVGASGAGKSIGALALMGLLPEGAFLSEGEIWFGEENITPPEPGNQKSRIAYEKRMEKIRGSKMAMIFQNPKGCLNPTMKIGHQIVEGVRAHKTCSLKKAKARAEELLELVGIRNPKAQMQKYPFQLSGGMCQRVAIAIALSGAPKLLIADEPTTALDVTVQEQILELLKKIVRETKTAVIVISHNLGVVASICNRVLILQEGSLLESGTVEEIFYESRHPYTKQLIADAKFLLPKELRAGGHPGKPILTVEHVKKQFSGPYPVEAVSGVSLELMEGETFALVGESGCGKTTLAKLIAGMYRPTEGNIQYDGTGMQMVFQDPKGSLDPKMTAGQSIEEPLILQKSVTRAERKKRVEEMLLLTGMSPQDRTKYPHQFSGGQQQRIGIARALIGGAQFLICDEAVSALDVSTQRQILTLLAQIQQKRQLTCLFISHDLRAVRQISHRTGVMYHGQLVEQGRTHEVCADPWHPYTKALLLSEPEPDPIRARRRKTSWMQGETAKQRDTGCCYATQCLYAMECCKQEQPEMYRFESRQVACFLYSERHTGKRSRDYKMTSQI